MGVLRKLSQKANFIFKMIVLVGLSPDVSGNRPHSWSFFRLYMESFLSFHRKNCENFVRKLSMIKTCFIVVVRLYVICSFFFLQFLVKDTFLAIVRYNGGAVLLYKRS